MYVQHVFIKCVFFFSILINSARLSSISCADYKTDYSNTCVAYTDKSFGGKVPGRTCELLYENYRNLASVALKTGFCKHNHSLHIAQKTADHIKHIGIRVNDYTKHR